MAHNKCRLCGKASGFGVFSSFFLLYMHSLRDLRQTVKLWKMGSDLARNQMFRSKNRTRDGWDFKREHDLLRFLLLILPETDLEFSNRCGHKLTVGNLNVDGFEYWPGKLISWCQRWLTLLKQYYDVLCLEIKPLKGKYVRFWLNNYYFSDNCTWYKFYNCKLQLLSEALNWLKGRGLIDLSCLRFKVLALRHIFER